MQSVNEMANAEQYLIVSQLQHRPANHHGPGETVQDNRGH